MIRSRSTRCRIGVAGRGLWYVDRLGYLPADLRTDERQLADLNRHLDPVMVEPAELAGDGDDWRDFWVGLATTVMLGVFVWAALALWVVG